MKRFTPQSASISARDSRTEILASFLRGWDMQHVFVLNHDYSPLAPCSPERARKLMEGGRAAMYRLYPFAIIMKEQVTIGKMPRYQLKIDPGASTTGIAIVRNGKDGNTVIWAANLQHKGFAVAESLQKRAALRRGRRQRNTRYRRPGFTSGVEASFGRESGWLPPSLRSRSDNIYHWAKRLCALCPIASISYELIKFDTQLMENPDIVGIEYQQGTLAGYEVREYLLEKWGRKCAYCGRDAARLEIEHITPKSRGGSNRISNLCIACKPCNDRKGTQTAEEFGYPDISARARRPIKDTAAVNTMRWRVYGILKGIGVPIETGSGGRTKWNRTAQGYTKEHWIDAACVGESGASVRISPWHKALLIKAMGRGSRQFVRVNKYGFPTAKPKARQKRTGGFATGDFVKMVRRDGEIHRGRISTGGVSPEMKTPSNPRLHIGKKDRVTVAQYNDGYAYSVLDYPQGK